MPIYYVSCTNKKVCQNGYLDDKQLEQLLSGYKTHIIEHTTSHAVYKISAYYMNYGYLTIRTCRDINVFELENELQLALEAESGDDIAEEDDWEHIGKRGNTAEADSPEAALPETALPEASLPEKWEYIGQYTNTRNIGEYVEVERYTI